MLSQSVESCSEGMQNSRRCNHGMARAAQCIEKVRVLEPPHEVGAAAPLEATRSCDETAAAVPCAFRWGSPTSSCAA